MITSRLKDGHSGFHVEAIRDAVANPHVSQPGRIGSIAAGAILVYKGIRKLKKAPAGNILRLALGGYLLYRGISGNCPVSKLVENRSKTFS